MTPAEGWYLMSVPELERVLARFREGAEPSEDLSPLTKEEAMAFRDAGNVPDESGRSLRLVLHVRSAEDVVNLSSRRLEFEPDFHEEPTWRREGSVPINVVPLRLAPVADAPDREWWADPNVAELEDEWQRTGLIEGVAVPEEYRSFVYKTVLSLRAADRPVTVETICASVARWLSVDDTDALRSALEAANA